MTVTELYMCCNGNGQEGERIALRGQEKVWDTKMRDSKGGSTSHAQWPAVTAHSGKDGVCGVRRGKLRLLTPAGARDLAETGCPQG